MLECTSSLISFMDLIDEDTSGKSFGWKILFYDSLRYYCYCYYYKRNFCLEFKLFMKSISDPLFEPLLCIGGCYDIDPFLGS